MNKKYLSILLIICLVLEMSIGLSKPLDSYADEIEESVSYDAFENPEGNMAQEDIEQSNAKSSALSTDNTLVSLQNTESNSSLAGAIGNLWWTLDKGILVISGSGGMSEAGSWYGSREEITEIIIKDGVTTVAEKAFNGCVNLEKVTLPSSLTDIGSYAFQSCSKIEEITIPENVTQIGIRAFESCTSLKQVTIPQSVVYIRDYAFRYCSNLKTIYYLGTKEEWGAITLGSNYQPPHTGGSGVEIIGTAYPFPNNVEIIYKNDDSDSDNDISEMNISLSQSSYIYDGTEKKPTVTVKSKNGKTLTKDTDYTVSYSDNTEIGTAKVTVTGIGDYTGTKTVTFAITSDSGTNPTASITIGGKTFDKDISEYLPTSSTTYSSDLAAMLMALAYDAYDEESIKASYDALKLEYKQPYNYGKAYINSVGYMIGKKTLSDGSNLVVITARGSANDDDWLHNFIGALPALRSPQWHQGFMKPADDIFSTLSSLGYIDANNTKYIVTGHSRGAAAANLLSVRLYENGISKENVYDYNFACPDVALDLPTAWNTLGNHDNMFNIANAGDLISYVPGVVGDTIAIQPYQWGKFGKSYWFSTNWNNMTTGGGNISTDVHGQDIYKEILYNNRPSISSFKDYFGVQANVAKLLALNNLYSFVKIFTFFCPVDFVITDSNGTNIVSYLDGEVNYYDSDFGDVIVCSDGDRKAVLISDVDEEYTVKMIGTDDGIMTYSVQSMDIETEDVIDTITYENVALAPEKYLYSVVSEHTNADVSDTTLFVTDETYSQTVKKVKTDGEEIEVSADDSNDDKTDSNDKNNTSNMGTKNTDNTTTASVQNRNTSNNAGGSSLASSSGSSSSSSGGGGGGSSSSSGGTLRGSGASKGYYTKIGKSSVRYDSSALSYNAKTAKVPATIKINKKTYKVTSIASDAFIGYDKLTSITIGKNVKKIAKDAFNSCDKLTAITINSKKLTAEKVKGAFADSNIKTVYVPADKVDAYKKIFTKKITGSKKDISVKAKKTTKKK